MSQCAFGCGGTVTFEPEDSAFGVRRWGMGIRDCPESVCAEPVRLVCAGATDLHAASRMAAKARTGTVGGRRESGSIAAPGTCAAYPAPLVRAAVG